MKRVLLLFALAALLAVPAQAGPADTFLEAWRAVQKEFYDPTLRGLDWEAVRREFEPRARQARTDAELSPVLNEMLERLEASHTRYYPRHAPEYFQLLDIFRMKTPAGDPPVYPGIPVVFQQVEGAHYVLAVLGGPLEGVQEGDRLVSVDGGPPIPPGVLRDKRSVRLGLQSAPEGPTRSVAVRVRNLRPRELFLQDLKASARVIPVAGRKAAYVRVWSYAGEDVQEALLDALSDEPLRGADGLVLDLRGGWGGASPDFLNMFNRNVPATEFLDRKGSPMSVDRQWRKPAVLIVDEGSRSGKEIVADGFQRYGLGPVVGARTAGAVLGGRAYPMKNAGLLYLAVVDVTVDGRRLEGVGVTPDVPVARSLPYSAGRDPQLEAALEILRQRL